MNSQRGFTLIELMITVALVAIVSAIAYGAYSGYTDTAGESVLRNNIESIRVFQEDARLRTGAYVAGTYDVGGGDTSLTTNLGWQPNDGSDDIVYVVALDGGGWTATATSPTGTTICRAFAGAACP